MSDEAIRIREIQAQDNPYLEKIIKSIFPEFNMPLVGTAYEDWDTANMFEAFSDRRAAYFVLADGDNIYGGGGIKPLAEAGEEVCELQKMYFIKEIRGKGWGRKMMDKCLSKAKDLGYSKCYLESASVLKTAIRMYETYDFKYLDKPMGNTGHYSCGVWMLKEL